MIEADEELPAPLQSLVTRVLAGELRRDDLEVVHALQRHPELAARIDELQELQRALDVVQRGERDQARVLAEAAVAGPVPGEERFVAGLRRMLDRAASSERVPRVERRSRWRSGLLAAVAAVLLGLLAWWIVAASGAGAGDGSDDAGDQRLGAPMQLLAPSGPVEDFSELRWAAVPGPGVRYEVVVGDDAGNELARSSRAIDEPRWVPPSGESARWPRTIRWQVVARDASGQVVAQGRARAWR